MERQFNMQRQLLMEYLQDKEQVDDWDSWLKEKDSNAVQEQQTEEVSVQEEAESSEEVIEAQEEEKE